MSPRKHNRRRRKISKPGNRTWRRANPLLAAILKVEKLNNRRDWVAVPVPPLGVRRVID